MGAIRRLDSLVRVPAAIVVAFLAMTMAFLTPSVASAEAQYPPTTAIAGGGGALPATGSDVDGIVIGATGLLAAGALTVLATRRRRHSHAN
jgi:LPXTG-motif cell wall-anchored protein